MRKRHTKLTFARSIGTPRWSTLLTACARHTLRCLPTRGDVRQWPWNHKDKDVLLESCQINETKEGSTNRERRKTFSDHDRDAVSVINIYIICLKVACRHFQAFMERDSFTLTIRRICATEGQATTKKKLVINPLSCFCRTTKDCTINFVVCWSKLVGRRACVFAAWNSWETRKASKSLHARTRACARGTDWTYTVTTCRATIAWQRLGALEVVSNDWSSSSSNDLSPLSRCFSPRELMNASAVEGKTSSVVRALSASM